MTKSVISANSIIEDALKVKQRLDDVIIEALDPDFPLPHLDPEDNITIGRMTPERQEEIHEQTEQDTYEPF